MLKWWDTLVIMAEYVKLVKWVLCTKPWLQHFNNRNIHSCCSTA